MKRVMRAARLIVVLAAIWSAEAWAQTEVSIPSADLSGGPGLMLKAFWFPAAASEDPAPAVVMLHGCGGVYDRSGGLNRRMRDYAALLNHAGLHALVVDSLTARGETQICTQKPRGRLITQAHRRVDALSSLEWLAARADVDGSRLGLLGWSNGGSTVLATTNERHQEVAAAKVKPSFAVAFYPGCGAELQHGYATPARVLLLVGEEDEWTPADACQRLVLQASEPRPEIESYAGAYHAFDSSDPVRVRTDVPNGLHPGQAVHVGGNAQAFARSRERLLQFLEEVVGPR